MSLDPAEVVQVQTDGGEAARDAARIDELASNEPGLDHSHVVKIVLADLPKSIEVKVHGNDATTMFVPKRPKAKPILASQRDGVAFYFDDSAVCGSCGRPLTRCGIPYPLNYVWQNFCPTCGTEIER